MRILTVAFCLTTALLFGFPAIAQTLDERVLQLELDVLELQTIHGIQPAPPPVSGIVHQWMNPVIGQNEGPLDFPPEYTVTWIGTGTYTTDAWERMISQAVGPQDIDHRFMISNGNGPVRVRACAGGNTITLLGGVLLSGVEQRIDVTYDGAFVIVYMDGVQVASASHSGPACLSNGADLILGGQPPGPTNLYPGTIAESTIRDFAMTGQEIQDDMGVVVPPQTGEIDTPAELTNALASASPGDTIVATGNMGDFAIGNSYTGMVTVQGGTFNTLSLIGASHVRMDGILIDNPTNGVQGPGLVDITNSNNIEVINSEIHALVDTDVPGWYGVLMSNSDTVLLHNNFIHDVSDGIFALAGSSNIAATENVLDRLGSDALKFDNVTGILVENNTGAVTLFIDPSSHADFLQFQASSSDITIRGNVAMGEIQGIFLADGTYDNVLIEDNVIVSAFNTSIALFSGSNVTIRNNTTLTVPGGGVHGAALIFIPPGAVFENNVQSFHAGAVGVSEGNLTVQWADPAGAFYQDLFYTNASGVTTIQDLLPVPGSLGETMGAFNRILELQ